MADMGGVAPAAARCAERGTLVDDPGLRAAEQARCPQAEEVDLALHEGAGSGGGAGVCDLAEDEGQKATSTARRVDEARRRDEASTLPAWVGEDGLFEVVVGDQDPIKANCWDVNELEACGGGTVHHHDVSGREFNQSRLELLMVGRREGVSKLEQPIPPECD
ncbi:hypothetical protein AX15_000755 [Amanita polypyramis BW_CC]|nr:hypothetical protein AX15_000755 [Amanita polypyramis BW_CC]